MRIHVHDRRDGFVEVQQHAGDVRPGGEFGCVERFGRHRREPGLQQCVGGGWDPARYALAVPFQQRRRIVAFPRRGVALQRQLPGPGDPLLRRALAFAAERARRSTRAAST